MIRRATSLLVALLCAAAAHAGPVCENLNHEGQSFTVCRVDMEQTDLRLFLRRADGGPFASFGALDSALLKADKTLTFAMNAGMYHPDRSPVGLYIEEGEEVQRLITSAGPGNFGMLPNGVLCIREGRADVIESLEYAETRPECRFATQSGPMLVIDGNLHPRFLPDSTSRYIRNGVGTSADGREAVFAISNTPVTFHEFGTLYRDVLNLPNALYFDGNISRLYAPSLGRHDAGFAMGPIVGAVDGAH